jgi:diguanylate cyclase (GGDEF)-like protein
VETEGQAAVVTQPDAQDRAIRVLMSLADDLTVEHDETGLLASALEHVVHDLNLAGGVTFILDAEQALVPLAEVNVSRDEAAPALEAGRAAVERELPVVRELAGGGWLAATPLRTSRHLLGALVLYCATGDGAAPDADLLQALGKQVGTGIENVRLYAELRSSSTRTEILNRITSALTSSMDVKATLPLFAREIGTLLEFDRLVMGFVNDSGDYLEVVGHPEGASWGLGEVVPVVGSGPGSVVLNCQAILQDDILRSHRFIEDMRLLEEGIRSYVVLPLNSRGRAIGILGFASKRVGAYDAASLGVIQPIADAVALALENVRLFQKTRELSITDEITPLFNFRHFHQILARELKLVDRYKSVLSLIFLDLDRFKPINDQWGHLRGSRVLREVGFLLRSAVRETDYPARYGGDEFCIICPQSDREAAVELGDRVRDLIEGHVFLQEEGIDARLGLSYGVAVYPQDVQTKEALIRLADERMYANKDERKAGR